MSDFPEQLEALRQGALLRRAPEFATLVVTGSDRKSWLHGLVTCDVNALALGHAAYGLSVGQTGKIVSDLWIAVGADAVFVAVEATQLEQVRTLFEQHLIMEDAELSPAPELAWTFAYGPARDAVLERVSSAALRCAARGSHGPLSAALLLGDDAALARACELAVAHCGAVVATEPGWLRARVEHVLPRFGEDFGAVYPQEASLEKLAVSFGKGCYLGQEAVFMLEKRGQAARKLVSLTVAGTAGLEADRTVATVGGDVVGAITSACPADGQLLALATVRRVAAVTGTELFVAGRRARVLSGLDA